MKKFRRFILSGASAAVMSAVAALVGCELSNSPNNTVRNVSVDFSGFYSHGGAALSSKQTGATVTSLDLRQTGDRLEAVDNNGIIFKGSLGEVSSGSGTASSLFELDGKTTANGDVTISGTISGSGNNGTMSGTWIEPNLFGNFFAQGSISTVTTNTGGGGGQTNITGTVSISPSSTTLANNLQTTTFTASGGTGSFTSWVVSDTTKGNLNTASGSTVVYTRISAGNNTVTVRDSNGATASATISQP